MAVQQDLYDRMKAKFPHSIQVDTNGTTNHWDCACQSAAFGTWSSTIGILSSSQTFFFQNKEDLDAFRMLLKLKFNV